MKLLKRASTKVVALGGGIACGKSTVRNIFSKNGWTVLDCDVINKEKVLGNPIILEKIKQTLSVYGIIDENNISKSIAKIVFSNNEARSKLEAIAFPIIVDYIKTFCEDWRLTQSNKILIEVPLLFEPRAFEFNNLFDKLPCNSYQFKIEFIV
jgi:dephospho-CoA kinase